MTREQFILWDHLHATFNITASVPLYFQGPIAGSEFLTYAATKLYLSFSLYCDLAAPNAVQPSVVLYNAADAIFFNYCIANTYWDATAAAVRFIGKSDALRDVYFSRLILNGYTRIRFIGYRLTRT